MLHTYVRPSVCAPSVNIQRAESVVFVHTSIETGKSHLVYPGPFIPTAVVALVHKMYMIHFNILHM